MKNIYPVSELCNGTSLLSKAPRAVPVIYKWWFPSNSRLFLYLTNYVETHEDDMQMKYMVSHLEYMTNGTNTYYALYLGKSVNGRRRFGNHIRGPKRYSTLRRTIAAVLQTNEEEEISRELNKCYYEWKECRMEKLKSCEKDKIKKGMYPLNLQVNPKISAEWEELIQQLRKKTSAEN